MGVAEDILAINSRKRTEPIHFPEFKRDVIIQELDTDGRLALLMAMDFESGKVDLSSILPFVTGLVLDPSSHQPIFGLEHHDTLVTNHPGPVQRILFKAIDISDLGEIDATRAEGNSEEAPS